MPAKSTRLASSIANRIFQILCLISDNLIRLFAVGLSQRASLNLRFFRRRLLVRPPERCGEPLIKRPQRPCHGSSNIAADISPERGLLCIIKERIKYRYCQQREQKTETLSADYQDSNGTVRCS